MMFCVFYRNIQPNRSQFVPLYAWREFFPSPLPIDFLAKYVEDIAWHAASPNHLILKGHMTLVFYKLLIMKQHRVWNKVSFSIYVVFLNSLWSPFSIIFFTNKLFWCKGIWMLRYFHVVNNMANIYLVCKNRQQWFINGRSIYWIILTFQLMENLFRRFLELHYSHLFSSHSKIVQELLHHQ